MKFCKNWRNYSWDNTGHNGSPVAFPTKPV